MTVLRDPDDRLLGRIEAYCDLVPRTDTVVHDVGAFTLFVSRGGPGSYDFYARPRLGLVRCVTTADVGAVLERQGELGVPQALEWVAETTPSLLPAARSAGLVVQRCPLLVLEGPPMGSEVEAQVRVLGAEDPDLPRVRAAISVGFAYPGTATGPAGLPERDAVAQTDAVAARRASEDVRAGRSVVVGAVLAGRGAVGGGSHRPRGGTTEIVGVGVLPAFRRRGLAGAVTATLARQATDSGVTTVFCGAEDDAVARVYERIGFRRVGTACLGRMG